MTMGNFERAMEARAIVVALPQIFWVERGAVRSNDLVFSALSLAAALLAAATIEYLVAQLPAGAARCALLPCAVGVQIVGAAWLRPRSLRPQGYESLPSLLSSFSSSLHSVG